MVTYRQLPPGERDSRIAWTSKQLLARYARDDQPIDIGCGHGFTGAQQVKYARDVAGQLAAGGTLMLYAHRPTPERDFGWTPDQVKGLFEPHLSIVWQALSEDSSSGSPAGWYRLTKT
jgi:hypothetical protein